MNDPKPMTITWAEARRSIEEGARWNAALPAKEYPPALTPRPKPGAKKGGEQP